MAAIDTTRTEHGALGLAARIGGSFAMGLAAFSAWNDARVTRSALSRLSDRELQDIGLGRGDIDDVANRTRRF